MWRADRLRLGLLFLSTLMLACVCVLPVVGQNTTDDVHIRPRIETTSPTEKVLVDPSLKTHDRPMKVNVDMVLVPVTITDPMNRLVTGLDRENFSLFEGKDAQ